MLTLETFLGPNRLNVQFMKFGVKIFLFLLAPAQISVPVDEKREAAAGTMLCLIQYRGTVRLLFQLMRRAVQKKYNYSFD